MGTRLHPGCDAFEKMKRDELLWWIRNECYATQPIKSRLLWMKWNLESNKQEQLARQASCELEAYTQLPVEQKTLKRWRSVQSKFDTANQLWKKCQRTFAEYKKAFELERPSNQANAESVHDDHQ